MYFSKKRTEDVPEEITAIWSCVNENCNGWMRENFAFSDEPTCPKCHSSMEKGVKKLPLLVNMNDQYAFKKHVHEDE